MKILHVMNTHHPLPHAAKIMLGLQGLGFHQSTFLPHPMYKIPAFQKLRLRYRIWVAKPDIIHCWTAEGAQLIASMQGGQQRKKPVITGWFGTSADSDKFQSCRQLVSASRHAAHRAQKAAPGTKVRFIPKAPDISAQAPIDRVTLATTRDAKVMIVFVRSLRSRDIETLLAVLKELPQWVGWFVGTGVWRHELEMGARQQGIIDRIRFLKRRQDRAALLRAADACVVPPRNDPFGTVTLEAWAAGTPVVVCGDAAGQIEDCLNGLVVSSGDAKALGNALTSVEDKDLRRSLISRAYATYIKDYTQDSVLRQWAAFFKSCAGLS